MVVVPNLRKTFPRKHQARLQAISGDLVFGIGPAGTGKTYLAGLGPEGRAARRRKLI
jgi:hypothetical protein